MSYFTNVEDRSSIDGLGCGSECSCGPCKSGMSGLNEWYEQEEEEEAKAQAPAAGAPVQGAERPRSETGLLNGWHRPGPRLGYHGSGFGRFAAPAPETEQELLQNAIARGGRMVAELTALIFFRRHPNQGSVARANETALINEWAQIQNRVVLPALPQRLAVGNSSVRNGPPPPPGPGLSLRLGEQLGPSRVCEPAANDVAILADAIKWLNNELARPPTPLGKTQRSLERKQWSVRRSILKKRLVTAALQVIIDSLDSYIQSGCCAPQLKALEADIKALPWPADFEGFKVWVVNEVVAAQKKAPPNPC